MRWKKYSLKKSLSVLACTLFKNVFFVGGYFFPKNPKIESIRAKPLKAKHKKIKNQINKQEINEKIAKFMKLMCDKCGQEQENFAALRLHMQKLHNVKGYAVCCSKKFFRRTLLTDHIDKHLNPERFK